VGVQSKKERMGGSGLEFYCHISTTRTKGKSMNHAEIAMQPQMGRGGGRKRIARTEAGGQGCPCNTCVGGGKKQKKNRRLCIKKHKKEDRAQKEGRGL